MQPVAVVPESKYRAPKNAFINNNYKKKEYTHTENDFPELFVQPTIQTSTTNSQLNYKSASTTVTNIVETIKLTPGWAYLIYNYGDNNSNRTIKCEYEPAKIPREKTFNEEANIVFDKMVDTWEKYRTDFIEAHGLEYYESLYKFPNDQYSNVDNDESDYDEYDYDDYDEYDDYYYGSTSKKFDSV